MLFSTFLESAGGPLIDAKSQILPVSSDITIDVDTLYNVHILDASGEFTVTVPNPSSPLPTKCVVVSGDYDTTIIINGDEYVVGINQTYFLDWAGTTWIVSMSDIIEQVDNPDPPPLTEYKMIGSSLSAGDLFGRFVEMSTDGTRCIVSATGSDTVFTDGGAAYIFFWNGVTWVEEQVLIPNDLVASKGFGINITMSGDGTRCAVAAYDLNVFGSVYVFSRSGTTWTQEQKLMSSDGAATDKFGQSICMSSGGETLLVGAYRNSEGVQYSGAVYSFSRSGTTWTEDQKMRASVLQGSQGFGRYLSISGDGTRCLVGAYYDYDELVGSGAVYVFFWNGVTWVEEQKVKTDDTTTNRFIGESMSMSYTGDRFLCGSRYSGEDGFRSGAAYSFTRSGTTWTQEQKIFANDTVAENEFGTWVSMSNDGTKAIISASKEGSVVSKGGAVYVFTRTGTTWSEGQKIISSDVSIEDFFGYSISISGDGTRMVAGSAYKDTFGLNSGTIYIYHNI